MLIYIVISPTEKQPELPTLKPVPEQVQPIRDYVTNCLKELAVQAFKQIGARGGYLSSQNFLATPFDPTGKGASAVKWDKNSNLIVPYWYYLPSENDCDEKNTCSAPISQRPALDTIKRQVEGYVKQNFDSCIADFSAFKQQNFIVEKQGELKVDVLLTDSDVGLVANYPLTVSKDGVTTKIDQYIARINLPFKRVYDLAKNITDLQEKYNFLETLSFELINTYSGLDKNDLPPVGDVTLDFGIGTVWIKSEIAKKLTDILASNIPLLQVQGTKNYRYITAPASAEDDSLFEILYNRAFFLPMNETNNIDLDVNFLYSPQWNPYFNLNCRGEFCTSESATSTLLFVFGIQQYRFAYDLSYPVMVSITSKDALDGQGYLFNFFLESNLRKNNPLKGGAKAQPSLKILSSNELCDPDKRTSGVVSLDVVDGKSKTGVDNADLFFNCGPESCAVGKIVAGNFNDKLPRCAGGVLSIQKQDYYPKTIPLDTDEDSQRIEGLVLEPYRNLTAKAKKIEVKKSESGWKLNVGRTELEDPYVAMNPDEIVTVILERKGTSYEEPYPALVELSGKNSKGAEINLVPGTYNVRIVSSLNPKTPLVIPPDKRCFKPKGVAGMLVKEKCFFIPEKPLTFNESTPLMNGQAEYEVTFTADQLDHASTIEFHYVTFALEKVAERARVIEDLDQISKLKQYNENAKDLIIPRIITK